MIIIHNIYLFIHSLKDIVILVIKTKRNFMMLSFLSYSLSKLNMEASEPK